MLSVGISVLNFSVVIVHADPTFSWHTFLGSTSEDTGETIFVDVSGNIYVAGKSSATWGSPVNPHAGGNDAFIVKLDSSGALQWHTFLGSSSSDVAYGIAVDDSGNVYVTGNSGAAWGSPVSPFSGTSAAFVAKLDSSGVLQWNTFMSTAGSYAYGYGIALDNGGDAYIVGHSYDTWGIPINAYTPSSADLFVAKLESDDGSLLWNTFMGSALKDEGLDIALDDSGNIYVVGESQATWGTPLNVHSGHKDISVAKLNGSGALQWHTFLGTVIDSEAEGIALDAGGNVYVTGEMYSFATSTFDMYVAQLNNSGALQWGNLFGGPGTDWGFDVAVDENDNVYVAGYSGYPWGTPENPHSSSDNNDISIVNLNGSGELQWHTFHGTYDGSISIYEDDDRGSDIFVDVNGNFYITGHCETTWGTPVNAFSGSDNDEIVVIKYLNPVQDPLKKAILTLQVLSGIEPSEQVQASEYDVDGDGKVGLAEAIHFLE